MYMNDIYDRYKFIQMTILDYILYKYENNIKL